MTFTNYFRTVTDMECLKQFLKEDGINYVVSVGDVTVERYMEWFGKTPNVVIIDGISKDECPTKAYTDVKDLIGQTVVKSKDTTSYELIDILFKQMSHHEDCVIYVIGEEDGALHPALLFADESTAVITGDSSNERMVYIRGGLEARTYAWSQINKEEA